MSNIILRALKIAIGAVLAIFIANQLGLNFYTSAGIIVILSIQNTRTESVKIALIRVLTSIIALLIAFFVFSLFNYTIITFGIFLLIFIPVAMYFKLQDGIVINSVLVSHLLILKSSTIETITNGLLLLLIGVLITLILNLYMPSNQRDLITKKKEVETLFKEIISNMSSSLRNQVVSIKEEQLYHKLKHSLKNGKNEAYNNLNNNLFISETYYVSYFNMRYHQFTQLIRMREYFNRLSITYSVTLFVANFIDKIAASISEKNNASPLLEELNKLRIDFKQLPLPKTRIEFENRAMLYQFLNELEQFLQIKEEFHVKYD